MNSATLGLYEAVKNGDLDSLQSTLESFSTETTLDLNTTKFPAENGCTLLHLAARYNHVNILQFLCDLGAKTTVLDKSEATPLHYASSDKCVDAIAFLMGQGANPNAKDCYELSPLWLALREKQFRAASILVLSKADLNAKVTAKGCTLLHAACEQGNQAAVQYLLDKGAGILRTDRAGESCMFTSLHSVNVVSTICKYAAQQNMLPKLLRLANDKGENIFHVFSTSENVNLDCMDIITDTLMRVSYCTLSEMMAQVDKRGYNPLHHAIKLKKEDVIEHLLRVPEFIRFDHKNADGDTPLHMAIRSGNLPIVEYLLNADIEGIGFETLDDAGKAPLALAEELRKIKIFQLLMQVKDAVDQTSAANIVAKDVENNAFTCLILMPEDVPNQELVHELNALTDNFYAVNSAVIAVINHDKPTTNELRDRHQINFRLMSDVDHMVGTRYGLGMTSKKKDLRMRFANFMSRASSERRSSIGGNSPPASPKRISSPSSPTIGGRSSSRALETPKSMDGDTLSAIMLLDSDSNVLYTHKNPDSSTMRDVVRVLSYYVQCAFINPIIRKRNNMEPKENVFDWILQNDHICKLFAAQLGHGLASHMLFASIDKIAEVVDRPHSLPKTKKSDPQGAEDLGIIHLYQRYITKHNEKDAELILKNADNLGDMTQIKKELRREAFKCFIQMQQFAQESPALVKKASFQDMRTLLNY